MDTTHSTTPGGVPSFLSRLLGTQDSVPLLLLRLTLFFVFFAHGSQKVLGWFGGAGWSGTMDFFQQGLGIPAFFAVLAIATEFLGSLALLLGLLTRVAALGIGAVMVVAVVKVHWAAGFFMNWYGNKQGEGFEYHLLVLGMVLALLVGGGGRLSLDRGLQQKVG